MDEKRYDLMNNVCGRGAYLLTRSCLPHMRKLNAHVLSVAPAPIPDASWLGEFVAYGTTKIAMSMLNLAWQNEFPHVRFNTIWPALTVATYAVSNNAGVNLDHCVNIAHMADPAYRIVTSEPRHLDDRRAGADRHEGDARTRHTAASRPAARPATAGAPPLATPPLATPHGPSPRPPTARGRSRAIREEDQVKPGAALAPDFMTVPEGLQAGQYIEYSPLPPAADLGALRGKSLVIMGASARTRELAARAAAEGARVKTIDFVAGGAAVAAALTASARSTCST